MQQPTLPLTSPTHSFTDIDTLSSDIRATTDDVTAPDMLHDDCAVLTDNLKRLTLGSSRFFGKSSGAVLIQAAWKLKQEYTQLKEPITKISQKRGFTASRIEFWAPHEVCWLLTFTFVHSLIHTFTILVGVGNKFTRTIISLHLPR